MFEMGVIVVTRGVGDLMDENRDFAYFVGTSLVRYSHCEWGELVEDDRKANDAALFVDDRIMGSYENGEHPDWKIWIITEWDRSVTTILFPDEC